MAFHEKGKDIFTTKTAKISKGESIWFGQKAAQSKPQPLWGMGYGPLLQAIDSGEFLWSNRSSWIGS